MKDYPEKLVSDPTVRGIIAQHLSAAYDNEEYVDETGYDQYNPVTGMKTEVKYTCYVMNNGYMRIQSIKKKKGLCDFVKIIDGISNREFKIPHDEFFNRGSMDKQGQFTWSSTYNKKDKKRVENTKLLLQYEVIKDDKKVHLGKVPKRRNSQVSSSSYGAAAC